jgi:tetratricopeptide (TPR) repeat protein
MSRTNQILILILVLEIALVAVVFIQKQNSVVAPVPSAASIDSITASDLSELAGACNTAEEWHSLANIYMSAGFFAEADVCFREAIELRPEWGDAIFNYGFCLSRFGQTSEANLQFQKVVDLSHSKSSEAAYFMGRDYLREERPELAETAFLSATPLPMAHFELARLYFRQGKFDSAREQLARVLSLQPDASRAKLLMSEIAAAQNQEIDKISFSSEGSEQTQRLISPFKAEKDRLMKSVQQYGIERELAKYVNLIYDGDLDKAKIGLENLQSIEWTPTAQEALIEIAMQSNQPDQVVSLIREQLDRFGPTTVWLGKLGEVLMRKGDAEGAARAWQQGVQVRNDTSVDTCYQGLIDYYSNRDQSEADRFRRLLILDRAAKAIRRKAPDQSIALILQSGPEILALAETNYLLGKAYRLLSQPDEAVAAYQKCLAIKPNHGKAIRELRLAQAMTE